MEAGRWLSADPIGEEGGFNLYGYVANNPVSSIDQLGLETLILIQRHQPEPGQEARDACGTMSVFHDGQFQFSVPVNRYGYQKNKNGRQSHGLYPGNYDVLPRTDEDPTSKYPNGTPSVTAKGYRNPGDAGNGYKNVYIHKEYNMEGGDSRGCPTVPEEAANKIKEFMNSDQARSHRTTLKIILYKRYPYAIPR